MLLEIRTCGGCRGRDAGRALMPTAHASGEDPILMASVAAVIRVRLPGGTRLPIIRIAAASPYDRLDRVTHRNRFFTTHRPAEPFPKRLKHRSEFEPAKRRSGSVGKRRVPEAKRPRPCALSSSARAPFA